MNKNKYVWAIISISFLTGTASLKAAEKKPGYTLEEVIVTARKREENLQETPIAITAFTANDLEKRQLSSLEDLDDATPSLVFETGAPSSGSNSAVSVSIRGIGQLDFTPTTDPGVGIYVDGVYYARAVGSSIDFFDLERVQILRGPQGTLFGRNTIGGAIDIISKKPSDEFGGDIRMTIGSDNRFDISGNIDIPLSDTFLSKLSGSSRSRDGYVKNNTISNAPKLGDDDSSAIRAALLWIPSKNFEVSLTTDYAKEREESAPNVLIETAPNDPFPSYHNNVVVGDCAVPESNPACFSNFYVQGKDVTNSTQMSASELDFWGFSAQVIWDLDFMSVKSITAYRNLKSFSSRDADHAPFVIFETTDILKQDQFSQEFQFSGSAYEDRLQWLVGLYYFKEEALNTNNVDISLLSILSGGSVDNTSKAVFAQTTYTMSDKLDITLGLRYTEDKKAFTPDQFLTTSFGPFTIGDRILPHITREEKFSEVTPMINFAYQAKDDLLTYFTYSEGFKSGGFTQRIFPPIVPAPGQDPAEVIPAYDPEFVKSYELGLKSKFWDKRAQLNVALFYLNYSDLQVLIRKAVASVLVNAGKATIEGIEVEFTVLPTEGLTVQVGTAYTNAGYDEIDPRAIGITKNTDFANTPEFTFSGSIAYEFLIEQIKGSLTPRIDAKYSSEVYKDPIGTEALKQDAFTLINVSIAYNENQENWSAMLGVRNLSDKKYLHSGSSTLKSSGGYIEGIFDRGRTWSLSVKYNF